MSFSNYQIMKTIEIIKAGRSRKRRGISPLTLAEQLGFIGKDTSKSTFGKQIVGQIREDIDMETIMTIDETYIIPILPADLDLLKEWNANRARYAETVIRRTSNGVYIVGRDLHIMDFEDATELLNSSAKLIRSATRKIWEWNG